MYIAALRASLKTCELERDEQAGRLRDTKARMDRLTEDNVELAASVAGRCAGLVTSGGRAAPRWLSRTRWAEGSSERAMEARYDVYKYIMTWNVLI